MLPCGNKGNRKHEDFAVNLAMSEIEAFTVIVSVMHGNNLPVVVDSPLTHPTHLRPGMEVFSESSCVWLSGKRL